MTPEVAAALLPPSRPRPEGRPTPYRVAVVCLGNICRSPMADVVLNDRLIRAGLERLVEVVSAGTGDWHVGRPMDRRAAALLTAHGDDARRHRAQQFASSWVEDCDLVLAMDEQNRADVTAEHPAALSRTRMFREFDPQADDEDRDVPDPYYGGDDGFERVLAMVERTSDTIVSGLALAIGRGEEGD